MDHAENPYAPPIADPASPKAAKWYLEGDTLVARPGAILPPVDLVTGVVGREMKIVPRQFQPRSLIPGLIYLVMFAAIFGQAFLDYNIAVRPLEAGVLAMVLIKVSRLFAGRPILVMEHRERWRANARVKRRNLRLMITIGSAVLLIGVIWLDQLDGVEMVAGLAGISMVGLLGALVWSLLDRDRPVARDGPGGTLQMRNLHPGALEELRRIERERPPYSKIEGSSPTLLLHLHRFRMRDLMDDRTRLTEIFNLIIHKWIRRSSVAIPAPGHEIAIDESEAAPELRASVEEWLAHHPDWLPVISERLSSPDSLLIQETIAFCDPSRTHLAEIAFHVAKTQPEKGRVHATFRTWTTDGRVWATISVPVNRGGKARRDALYEHFKGDPEIRYIRHLERVRDLDVSPAANVDEVRQRMKRDSALEIEAMIQARLLSRPAESPTLQANSPIDIPESG